MTYKPILREVLSTILPSSVEQDQASNLAKAFLKDLNAQIKRLGFSAKASFGGSYAKGTWLSGDYDIDVFVSFKQKHKDDDLSKLVAKALKKFKPKLVHGSRDYFWVEAEVKFEIVPVLVVPKSKIAKNVTDFSPLHVQWVNDKGKKYKDDIRLMKKFCKGAGCYGAESYIRGFSGHVVDILTIHNKGFLKTLRVAKEWKHKVIVDPSKVYKSANAALMMLNKSKTSGPLVVIDPVQPNRNAAAALTLENFKKFQSHAKKFLKNPSANFFVEKVVDFVKLGKRGRLLKVKVETVNAKEDVAGAKCKNAFEHLKAKLSLFGVIDSGWIWDKNKDAVWWFVLKTDLLDCEFEFVGPPLAMVDAVKQFKAHNKKTYVKGSRVCVKKKRDKTNLNDVVVECLNGEFIKSRVLSATL